MPPGAALLSLVRRNILPQARPAFDLEPSLPVTETTDRVWPISRPKLQECPP